MNKVLVRIQQRLSHELPSLGKAYARLNQQGGIGVTIRARKTTGATREELEEYVDEIMTEEGWWPE